MLNVMSVALDPIKMNASIQEEVMFAKMLWQAQNVKLLAVLKLDTILMELFQLIPVNNVMLNVQLVQQVV